MYNRTLQTERSRQAQMNHYTIGGKAAWWGKAVWWSKAVWVAQVSLAIGRNILKKVISILPNIPSDPSAYQANKNSLNLSI